MPPARQHRLRLLLRVCDCDCQSEGLGVYGGSIATLYQSDHAIAPQLSVLVAIILVTELICMTLYATGGRSLRHFLEKSGNVRILNRIAGTLMIAVGIWLASS